jgi:hypothetical protein
MFLENITQIENKIPNLNSAFSRGLTASFYILHDYTTSGHKGSMEYVCNIYIYIQLACISIQYIFIYLFMMHKNVRDSHHTFWYSPFQ